MLVLSRFLLLCQSFGLCLELELVPLFERYVHERWKASLIKSSNIKKFWLQT